MCVYMYIYIYIYIYILSNPYIYTHKLGNALYINIYHIYMCIYY